MCRPDLGGTFHLVALGCVVLVALFLVHAGSTGVAEVLDESVRLAIGGSRRSGVVVGAVVGVVVGGLGGEVGTVVTVAVA